MRRLCLSLLRQISLAWVFLGGAGVIVGIIVVPRLLFLGQ
jgi:hypothetical protein